MPREHVGKTGLWQGTEANLDARASITPAIGAAIFLQSRYFSIQALTLDQPQGDVLWVELCPPKEICWSPNPNTSERDLIWRRGL